MPVVDVRFDLATHTSNQAVSDKVAEGPSPRETCVICHQLLSNKMSLSLMGLQGPLLFSLGFAHTACSSSDIVNTENDIASQLESSAQYFWYHTDARALPGIAWKHPHIDTLEFRGNSYQAVDEVGATLRSRGLQQLRYGFPFSKLFGWEFFPHKDWTLFFQGRPVATLPPPPHDWQVAASEAGEVLLVASSQLDVDDKDAFQYDFANEIERAKSVGGIVSFFSPLTPNLKPYLTNVSFFTNSGMPEIVLELGPMQTFSTLLPNPQLPSLAHCLDLVAVNPNSPEFIPWTYHVSRHDFELRKDGELVFSLPLALVPVSFRNILQKHVMIFLTTPAVSDTFEDQLKRGDVYGGMATEEVRASVSALSRAKSFFKRT